jgi:hypothetical protein
VGMAFGEVGGSFWLGCMYTILQIYLLTGFSSWIIF